MELFQYLFIRMLFLLLYIAKSYVQGPGNVDLSSLKHVYSVL